MNPQSDNMTRQLSKLSQTLVTPKVAWETIVATFYVMIQFFHDLIRDPDLQARAISIGLKIGKIILGAYLVKTLISLNLHSF